ncbi:hypothetical protein Ndes2526B_g00516 [Nannochloris sp. 'desiccata']|nr:hypothetical protein NADE_003680 [Chlorella desiccata (nom. nud.)]
MGSHINIELVQRHLDSVGHTLSSQGVADLLRDLGFSVNAEKQEKVKCILLEKEPSDAKIRKKAIDEPILPSRTCIAVSTAFPGTAPGVAGNRAPASGANVASLAAKLDALETQINTINALQTNIHQKLDTDQQKLPRPATAAAAAVSVLSLGSEAQQLRDWAAGKWPNIQELRSKRSSLSVESERSSAQSSTSSTNPQISKRQGSRNTIAVKKRDPVARYQ